MNELKMGRAAGGSTARGADSEIGKVARKTTKNKLGLEDTLNGSRKTRRA